MKAHHRRPTSKKLIRYHQIKQRGIVRNRMTLKRWIDGQGFPPGIKLGPNTRAWYESDVEAWVEARNGA